MEELAKNLAKKRIGIDARLSGKKHAGIGRYIENLLVRLPLEKPEIKWVYFFYDKKQLAELTQVFSQLSEKEKLGVTAGDFLSRFEVVYAPISHYSWTEQKEMPRILEAEKLDLLHVPHFNIPLFYRGKIVITIHDLLWHEKKGLMATTLSPRVYWLKYILYRFLVGQAVKKTQKILVPTETTAKHVLHYYPRVKDKIIVTKEGFYQPTPGIFLDSNSHIEEEKFSVKFDLPKKYLLYVGSLYPHKNIEVVLKSLSKYLTKIELIIVGSRSIFLEKTKEMVADLNLEKRVHFLGFVDDNELAKIYQRALVLIQPSFWEGFGLTGLEAMNFKTPVLASNIPVFHEVYGEAALFFDPQSSKDLAKKIEELTPELREKMIKRGEVQTQIYDWQKMTYETLRVYQQILRS